MGKLRWAATFALAVCVALALMVLVFEPVRVEGYSMQPRLDNNERLFVDRFAPGSIQRGDVVVFHYPRDPTQSFIKRVIGLPGEHVQIRAGVVLIDGRLLVEPYVPPAYQDFHDFAEVVVPSDSYFVMGDHRDSSNDSRNWGFLDRQYIFGRAVFAYWPMQHLGLVH